MATDNNEAFLGATTNSYKWNHHENAESLCKLGNLKPAAPGAEVSTHHPLKVKHSEQQQQQTDWARTWPGGAGKGKVLPFFGRSLFLSLSFSPAASLPLGSWPFWLFLLWFSLQHFVRARSLAIFVLRQGSRSRIPKRMQLRPASSSVSVDLCQRIVVCNAAEFTFTPY